MKLLTAQLRNKMLGVSRRSAVARDNNVLLVWRSRSMLASHDAMFEVAVFEDRNFVSIEPNIYALTHLKLWINCQISCTMIIH